MNTTLSPWAANGTPRRAGVSSFGFGGTNAHVILEEAPAARARGALAQPAAAACSSAQTTEASRDGSQPSCADHLERSTDADLADVAYTLAVGRRDFAHRRAVVCADGDEAIDVLHGRDGRRVFTGDAAGQDAQVVFMFPGQGSQYVNMGAGSVSRRAGLPRGRGRVRRGPAPATRDAICSNVLVRSSRGRSGGRTAEPDVARAVGVVRRRVRAGAAVDVLGIAPAGDDRPQHRRARRRLPCWRVHTRRGASARRRARPADAARCRAATMAAVPLAAERVLGMLGPTSGWRP